MKILLIEDEEKLRNELKIFLENSGYEVLVLADFSDTVNSVLNTPCDLILLDINIPNLNGEMVCKELRKLISIPIIIVTSRDTEIDELISINYGADDFITKPYNIQILLARIERLLIRNKATSNIIHYKDLILDMTKSHIKKGNNIIELSKNEVKILYFLINHKSTIVSRDDLMNYLWNTNEFIDDNTLTVNINRLRTKLDDLGLENAIQTKRGQGYMII